MQTPPRTFQEANDWFYRTFNLPLLTFGDVNYTKLVQKAMHDGWMQGAKTNFQLSDARMAILKNRVRNWFNFRSRNKSHGTYVVYFDSSRRFVSREGADESFYGEAWFNLLDGESISYGVHPEFISNRAMKGRLFEELDLLESFVAHCNQILGSSHPLLPHLEAICYNYLMSYGMASDLLAELKPGRILLTCHYGKEGLIRAARQNGVIVTELQHGIIDKNDIFYCYPKNLKGLNDLALFPDSILTYGQYWTDLLLEHHEFNKVITAGDYTFRAPKTIRNQKKQVLITTQTGLIEDYLSVIEWVASEVSHSPGWEILIRHHPLEGEDELLRYRDSYAGHSFVRESTGSSLSEDFQESMVHISIYSTTLFDAARWPLQNYSVQNLGEFSSYSASILHVGVAEGIEVGQSLRLPDRAKMTEKLGGVEKSGYFYSDFPSPHVLKDLRTWSA